ncbi:MAG: SpoIID/LytB domain-containing protein [Elusimicrobia bacterium]|nr:SpoIID/LytB domain-containing protein [Elusimicrobiota bacterium]
MADFKKIIFYFLICILFAGCHMLPVPEKRQVSITPVSVPVPERVDAAGKERKKADSKTIIKIGIIENSQGVAIGAESDFLVVDMETGDALAEMSSDNIYSVKAGGGKIFLDKRQFRSKIRIKPKNSYSELSKISVNGKMYRGSIILRRQDKNRVSVINELGLEEYICGVVPCEVGPDWPLESLKAQAVVARTFALKNMGKHRKDGFNLCSKTHCQVYGGASRETEKTNKAVYETAGEVITYNGGIISSYYHASCAGYTEDVNNVWESFQSSNPEYLSSVKCKFCRDYRWYNWTYKILFDTLASRLRNAGYKVGKIESIRTIGRTSSGRIKQVLIKHSKGKLRIASGKFRMAMHPDKIRSTNFIVKCKNDVAYFKGHGWGHGVGMCQWGAKNMAEDGWSYKKILEHYYKGCKVETEYK